MIKTNKFQSAFEVAKLYHTTGISTTICTYNLNHDDVAYKKSLFEPLFHLTHQMLRQVLNLENSLRFDKKYFGKSHFHS